MKRRKETCKDHPHCFSYLHSAGPSIWPLLSLQISTLVLSFSPLPLPLAPGTVGSPSSGSSGSFPTMGLSRSSSLGEMEFSCSSTAGVQQAPCPGFLGNCGAGVFLGLPSGSLISFLVERASQVMSALYCKNCSRF